MEKLTLEHISPYLPYGLNANYDTRIDKGFHYGENCKILGADIDGVKLYMPLEWLIYKYIKPILRPISWLRTDEGFDKYLELLDELEMVNCENLIDAIERSKYYAIDIQKYNILEKWMYSNHFDWKFNLIEKGLAVDVNTLEINPYN